MNSQLRQIPQIETLLRLPDVLSLTGAFSHSEVAAALRDELGDLRAAVLAGKRGDLPDFNGAAFRAAVEDRLTRMRQPNLRAVINATGIIIHTNLGRARLAPEALQAMQDVGAHPSNLEFNLETGKRGSRYAHAEALICELTGAEAALVVNNCAAAVVLGLMGTAMGRKVVVSRGELVEIGGSFRLPDVIAQSGATLKEVGATNKTRTRDYADAIDDDTAVLLKSHTSNFKIIGFTSSPKREDLAELAKAHDLILMEDLGSGVLINLAPYGLTDEPVVRDILAAGVDLVMFSGDKLLGGPQAGIIAGRADIIAGLRSHPLLRALRIDKLSLAALEATLRLYRAPFDPLKRVPVLRMLSEPVIEVEARAGLLVAMLGDRGVTGAEVVPASAFVGGGSLPQQDLASFAVSLHLEGLSADALAEALRKGATPIIGRIHQGRVQLDMRTVADDELRSIAAAIGDIASR